MCIPAKDQLKMNKVGSRQQLSTFKAEFFKALAHPLRISILDALREGELTVNEISQRFEIEAANASQQLAVLRNRNIVVARKEGANVYYSVTDRNIFKLLDAANAKSYLAVRGKDYFARILRNVRAFRALQEREGVDRPRVSAWLTGLKETIVELPAFVKVAAEIGVKEVYLQRLVFFENDAIGHARPDQALYEHMTREEAVHLEQATALARSYGITFSASGAASEPGMSLKRHDDGSPWSMCRRPWTVMYFTANGRALPCCIAPFSQRGYENYTLGDATQQSLQEIWNGAALIAGDFLTLFMR